MIKLGNKRGLNKPFRRTSLVNFLSLAVVIAALVGSYSLLEKSQHTGFMVLGHATASRMIETGKTFIVYGTAWKKERTADLVAEAVRSGFRFIDTACQPRHYNEAGVGVGWTTAARELGLQREDFFLQTKYTPFPGQDPNNCPYDPSWPIEEQVKKSLEVSLENLQTTYLDSWVMHSPMDTIEDTMTAWRTMETFVDEGKVKSLGISNCYDIGTFTTLYEMAKHKPKVLQNRFYAESSFDTELRQFVKDNHVWYQSFWTLTANRNALARPEVLEMAQRKNLNPQTLMFAFLMSLGYVTPLSGTTSKEHMVHDVEVMERIQSGEVFFETEQELRQFAGLLGMPDL